MLRFSLLVLALGIFFTSIKLIPNQPKTLVNPAVADDITDEAGDWSSYQQVLAAKTSPAAGCAQTSDLDILVDKFHPLPDGYIPEDLVDVNGYQLRSSATQALNTIINELNKEGLHVAIDSAFRSYSNQQGLYQRGSLTAAPPGFSEHQLGTAVDLKLGSGTWDWLDKNAHRFGFVMSYRGNQTTRTGYGFEPWHWRYVGVDLATKIRLSDKTPQSFYKPASCN